MVENNSFCQELKSELCKSKPTGCCRIALCYGLLLFSRSFCREEISIKTLNSDVAELYSSLLKLCFGVYTVTTKHEAVRTSYEVKVTGEADRIRIINFYDSGEADWIFNPKFAKRTCCRWAFIRGAFLACGSVNNPEISYHLEFAVKNPTLAFAFSAFLELCGHKPSYYNRKSVTAIFYNSSTAIEEILGSMGATQYSLQLMEVKVVKDMRNKLNRQNNFETANITKTVNASILQNEAIQYLENNNLLGLLPQELYEIANLRKQNPDASLKRLCELCGGSISRSGINHRLQRIIDFAQEAKDKSRI